VKILQGLKTKFLLCSALAVLFAGGLIPIFTAQIAYAVGLLTYRTIEMSSSANGGLTAGQGVTYTISFKTATAGAIEGIVIDFCDNSPIPGESCTYTAGQSINLTNVSWTGGSITGPSDTTTSNWTISKTSPLLIISDATSSTSEPTNTQVTIVMSGFTNPNYSACTGGTPPNCTFYARLFTYSLNTSATSYTPSPLYTTNLLDDGGVALSTNQQVTVTSKVQEQLTFCVYTGASCSAGGGSVTLGDSTGVLYTTGPFVDKTTQYSVSTNANYGLAIRMLGTTLTSGANTITAIGATPATSNPNHDQFGMCTVISNTAPMSLVAQSPYNNASCSSTTQTANQAGNATGGDGGASFGFDTNASTGTTSTYGGLLDQAAAGSSAGSATGVIAMIGNVAVTQAAGIYTTTLTFVATSSY
jgi:hypothetical protein